MFVACRRAHDRIPPCPARHEADELGVAIWACIIDYNAKEVEDQGRNRLRRKVFRLLPVAVGNAPRREVLPEHPCNEVRLLPN